MRALFSRPVVLFALFLAATPIFATPPQRKVPPKTPPAAAPQRAWSIDSFRSDIRIDRSGVVAVTETLEVKFVGSFNGIVRHIPTVLKTSKGEPFDLLLDFGGATDEAGAPLKVETSRTGNDLSFKIWIPRAENAVRTVVIRYSLRNAIRYFDDRDEIYWNATGTEWPVPIAHAEAHVLLPGAADANTRVVAYTGEYGSRANDADIAIASNQITFTARHPFPPRAGLTVVVSIPKGMVAGPSLRTRLMQSARTLAMRFARPFGVAILPLIVSIFLVRRLARLRGGVKQQTVVVRYDPPDGMTPAELGGVIDGSIDPRDISATIVDLAVRGYIRIRTMPEYSFEIVKPPTEWTSLTGCELPILRGLFLDGNGNLSEKATLSSAQRNFASTFMSAQSSIRLSLYDHGYWNRDSGKVSANWRQTSGALLGLAAFVWFVAYVIVSLFESYTGKLLESFLEGFAIGMLVTAAITFVGSFFIPRRTGKALSAHTEALGFKEFLERAESDHIARLQTSPELFERFLPYAMALGIEHQWAKAFDGIYRSAPPWLDAGAYPANSVLWVSSLSHFGDDVSSAFRSADRQALAAAASASRSSSSSSTWRSSGESSGSSYSDTSGFSDSGSSGGGSGGGGGDAF